MSKPLEKPKAAEFYPGLAKIRHRRWLLWALLLGYVPVSRTLPALTGSGRQDPAIFVVWVLLVGIVSCFSALCRCPRCGGYFHMKGFFPLYLRHCRHCGLGLDGADRGR